MARAQVEAFESQQAESEPLEPIDRELTTWLKGTKLEKDVSLDILAFWRDQEARLNSSPAWPRTSLPCR